MTPSEVELWNDKIADVWVDSDGDIGIENKDGYSIILSPKGAEQLREWLNKWHEEQKEKQ